MKIFSGVPHGQKMFVGYKRHSAETFSDASTTKKRKGTPGRSSVGGSPISTPLRPDICKGQADIRSKSASQCDTFIKRKKMTASNKMVIFQAVANKEREIIEYDDQPLSFYRIMAHYVGGLGMVPEDVRHKHVKDNLFTFIYKNVDYTKVTKNDLYVNTQLISNKYTQRCTFLSKICSI